MLKRLSTAGMGHDEWVHVRQKTIGGSDASAIAKLNPWTSPYKVWAQKTGRLHETPDSERLRQGRDLEAYVASRWMEATGKRTRRENGILYSTQYPFAHASIDRWVVGENAGLECKTTSILNARRFTSGEFPAHYWAQCLHYMAVTGASAWYLAVIVLNTGFYCYEIARSSAVQKEIDALMAAEREFYNCLTTETPPPVCGTAPTTDALGEMYPGGGGQAELTGRENLLSTYMALKSVVSEAGRKMERIKQTIMQDMGNCERGGCQGYLVDWKSMERTSFDGKRYANDNANLDLSRYFVTSHYRRFEVRRADAD